MPMTDLELRVANLEKSLASVIAQVTRLAGTFEDALFGNQDVPIDVFPVVETLTWLRGEVAELRLQLDARP